MNQTVIFDSDGVLIDSLELHWRNEIAVLAEHGVTVTREKLASITGMSENEWLAMVKKETGTDFVIAQVIEEFNARKLEEIHKIQMMPGVVSLLDQLKEAGFKLGIATGASRIFFEKVWEILGLEKWFSTYVTADDIEHCKPAPDIFLESAGHLDADPTTSVIFEDGVRGLEAGRAAGMKVVAYRQKEGPADCRIEDFGEMSIERIRSL